MLYTFSQADYDSAELAGYLSAAGEQDAVVLWQDGVLLALKYPHLFSLCQAACYALQADVNARHIAALMPPKVRSVSMQFFVSLTERYTPQLGL